jgi:hypothetical protein
MDTSKQGIVWRDVTRKNYLETQDIIHRKKEEVFDIFYGISEPANKFTIKTSLCSTNTMNILEGFLLIRKAKLARSFL